MGAINGVLVAWGRVPSIIVTLGTLAIYRGILVDYSGAKTVTTDSLPDWLVDLPRLDLFSIGGLDIRAMVVLALVIVIVFQLGDQLPQLRPPLLRASAPTPTRRR